MKIEDSAQLIDCTIRIDSVEEMKLLYRALGFAVVPSAPSEIRNIANSAREGLRVLYNKHLD